MCELEDVLYPFVDHHFANLTVDEQQSFAQLLAAEDTQLWAWLITKEQLPPAHLKIIINKINNAA
jgi:succinate dehydrogenase flavin-adding protein (antitoxin of CptAB toxin-antitoxin module)